MATVELKRGATTFKALPEDLWVVGIDTNHQEGEHHLWDSRILAPIDEAMVENIRRFGVKQPIIVEASNDPLHPFVKDGKRRVMHARLANELRETDGLPKVWLQVIVVNEEPKASALAMRLLNNCRLDDDVLAKAKFAADLLGQGCDLGDVAVAFGVSEQTVKLWTEKVVVLPERLKEAVRGGLGVQAALAMTKKPEEDWFKDAPATAMPDDEERATPDELPERKADKKVKKEKAPSKAQVEGARGKKWFKNMLRFREHLPAEFVQGMDFMLGNIEDTELPASIRKWVDGNRWDLGEINDPPSKTIANLISKTVKAEKSGVDE